MISSGYKMKTLKNEVPEQLKNNVISHDVILARKNLRIEPTGGAEADPNQAIVFDVSSNGEWCDLKTMYLCFTVTNVAAGAAGRVVKESIKNILSGITITVKGQSICDTLQSDNLNVYSSFVEKMIKSRAEQLAGEATYGFTEGNNGSNANTNAYLNAATYSVALPLAEIHPFFAMPRSYLPLMALPLNIRFQTAPAAHVYVGTAPTYKLTNVFMSADMLTMSDELEGAFRKSVSNGTVSFVYPNVHHQVQAGNSTAIKTYVNTQCADALIVVGMPDPTNTNYSPSFTGNNGITNTSKQAYYIDSRAVLSQPIASTAQRMVELKKANQNILNRYGAGPNLQGSSQLDSIAVVNANNQSRGYKICGVNLMKQLSPESYSGLNVALTGGRILVETGASSVSGVNNHLFVLHKSILELSENFVQVIR